MNPHVPITHRYIINSRQILLNLYSLLKRVILGNIVIITIWIQHTISLIFKSFDHSSQENKKTVKKQLS